MQKIKFTDPQTNDVVEFAVEEETTLNGTRYLLVSEGEESGDCEAYILKEVSTKDEEVLYQMVEDDVVIVRKQSNCDSGDIAVILVNGEDATVKKIKKTANGISLIPLNPTFDIVHYSNSEIENLPVSIVGKVVELRRKF